MKYICQLKDNNNLEYVVNTFDVKVLKQLKMLGYIVIEVPSNDVVQDLLDSKLFAMLSPDKEAKLMDSGEQTLVDRYEGVPVESASAVDSDNLNVLYWYHNAITNLNGASATNATYFYGNSGENVDVYIVDSGINANNPEITGRVFSLPETDYEASNNDDTSGHGTTVAQFVGGTRAGIATSANLWAAKWVSSTASIATALDAVYNHHTYKSTNNPSVVNMSFGVAPSEGNPNFFTDEDDVIKPMDSVIDDMIKVMIADGIHCVISAGNGFEATAGGIWGPMISKIVSPARVSLVSDAITVGATNTTTMSSTSQVPTNDMASFSNYDEAVTIQAPGHSMPHLAWDATDYSGDFYLASGTSFAAPLVTAVIAQWLSADPTITPAQMKANLLSVALDSIVTNLGGAHEATDGVLAWGGTINQISDTSETTVSQTAYNYQSSLLTPNKFLFNPWQQYSITHSYDVTSPIITSSDGNFGPIDGSSTIETLLGQTPFDVSYTLDNAPSGVTVDVNGNIIGSNVAPGSYTFDIISSNGFGNEARTMTLDVPQNYPPNWTVIGGTVTFNKA